MYLERDAILKRTRTGRASSISIRLPNVIQRLDDLVIERHDDGHVSAHSAQTRHGAFVEAANAFVLEDLSGTIDGALVLVRLQTLHSRLRHETETTKNEQRERAVRHGEGERKGIWVNHRAT